MTIRLAAGIVVLLVYLMAAIALGEKIRADKNLKNRLERVASSNPFSAEESERLSKPFFERVFKPVIDKLLKFTSTILPLSKKSQDKLAESLRNAGIQKTSKMYFASQFLICLALEIITFVVSRILMKNTRSNTILIMVFILCVYYVMARFMLSKKVTKRGGTIENDMPEILDLLSVSVSAGLGFDQALLYVTERCQGPLSDELAVTQREIRMGRSRSAALNALADRCNVEALRLFVSSITQAETLGIPISNILQAQAESVRQNHKQKVEEKAAKLPVKILIPLVFCIFPVMFIALLGPAVPQVMEVFKAM